jgi:hypothetical protein
MFHYLRTINRRYTLRALPHRFYPSYAHMHTHSHAHTPSGIEELLTLNLVDQLAWNRESSGPNCLTLNLVDQLAWNSESSGPTCLKSSQFPAHTNELPLCRNEPSHLRIPFGWTWKKCKHRDTVIFTVIRSCFWSWHFKLSNILISHRRTNKHIITKHIISKCLQFNWSVSVSSRWDGHGLHRGLSWGRCH